MEMNADDLYNALAGNAWKLAAQSTLDVDDIKQELYLLCMEVADGRSKYSPQIGGVLEYIMGRLWGLIRRWSYTQSLNELIDNDNSMDEDWETGHMPAAWDKLLALQAPSVEDVLMQRDELYEQDARDIEVICQKRERTRGITTLGILVLGGHWSLGDAAKYFGTSRSAIQSQLRSQKQLWDLRFSDLLG